MLNTLKKMIPNNIKFKIKSQRFIKEYNEYLDYCKKNNQEKCILFGTPKHGNIGDHAITIAIYKFMSDRGKKVFEVSSFDRFYLMDYIKKTIENDDIILINGGGFIGSQWIEEEKMVRDVVSSFKDNKIIIFPQTLYYKDDENGKKECDISLNIYNNHKDLTICTREKKSYNFVTENITNARCIFVPDIVLYLDNIDFNNKRENALFCLRSDPEKSVSNTDIKKVKECFKSNNLNIDYTDTVINSQISKVDREKIFYDKLEEFSKYKIVVTDRLHGMIFAAITSTPCLVFSNYNYKVKGVYEWIKNLDYISFIEGDFDADEQIKKLLNLDKYKNINILENKHENFKELIDLFLEDKNG